MRRWKRILGRTLVVALAVLVGVLSLRPGVYLSAHQYCIKQAIFPLLTYAETHGGRFPEHPAGYGNALLLVSEETTWHSLTGPGYDPDVFRDARASGRGLPEEQCGRVYVQGLKLDSNSGIVILFDKMSTPGGDHCHLPSRLWAPRGREVLDVSGGMAFIRDSQWPAFAAEQVEKLTQEGIPRAEAERLYAQASP